MYVCRNWGMTIHRAKFMGYVLYYPCCICIKVLFVTCTYFTSVCTYIIIIITIDTKWIRFRNNLSLLIPGHIHIYIIVLNYIVITSVSQVQLNTWRFSLRVLLTNHDFIKCLKTWKVIITYYYVLFVARWQAVLLH